MNRPEIERNHYSTLGAEEAASQDEIERLYKKLAVRLHPDRGGDEEEMKSLNEAYRVLGNGASRRAYDATRARQRIRVEAAAHRPSASPSAQVDALSGRVVGALLCVVVGLALLFVVRFQYILFLWPLALVAVGIIALGVLMAHGALVFARESLSLRHPARRFVWAQEAAFWFCVCGGVYGVYLVLSAI